MASMPNIDVTLKVGGHVSEREAVLRERRAAARMRCGVMHELDLNEPCDKPCAHCVARAVGLYPLPKIARPRVVTDPHRDFMQVWRCVGGRIEWGFRESSGWRCVGRRIGDSFALDNPRDIRTITPARIKLWAYLLANPTELVDDDGSAVGAIDPVLEKQADDIARANGYASAGGAS